MRQVTLPELLKRARGGRGLREMARRTQLPVSTIKHLEDGDIALPPRARLAIVADAYGLDFEDCARAAYGAYYEEATIEVSNPALVPA